MQSFESFGFAVELFMIIFSVFCWCVTPIEAEAVGKISETTSSFHQENDFSQNESSSSLSTEELATSQQDGPLSAVQTLTPGHIKQDYYVGIIEKLNLIEARKVASILKKSNIIDQSKKLSGKGIGRDWLIFLIQDYLPTHPETVKKALEQVLNQELL